MIKEDVPTNVTGANIAGTTPDTLGVSLNTKMKPKIVKRKGIPMNIFTKVYEDLKLDEAKKPDPLINKEVISNNVASELFARCRALATVAHFAHVSTDSYSEHMALSTFYTDIIDKIDAFTEEYIGLYGKFITLPPIPTDLQPAHDAIIELRDWISENRNIISDDSSIQNLIDELVTLINTTVYKLEKLS